MHEACLGWNHLVLKSTRSTAANFALPKKAHLVEFHILSGYLGGWMCFSWAVIQIFTSYDLVGSCLPFASRNQGMRWPVGRATQKSPYSDLYTLISTQQVHTYVLEIKVRNGRLNMTDFVVGREHEEVGLIFMLTAE